ncbi:MAG: bifunctional diaminohydroxyphosphoribosylaminopyrimidine deaminase/5-amino-6-(5-phosphoribosylamino)uracil reductase RibD [Sulfurimonas sp.]|nr:bifunctional diaminohydroxyphosphoribosylaminopyrimidine deaminase/5-amino-6-(5-phosphoribosylamino)uracil reductase RibD [Sulfurimonas sp.]MDQ7061373.1 bifunctional diaminohydroxyphosphoribosylaminopyrimidine deaminase/5-amino-6-(5-phosphoribosylamino)uracil reductase RibD [Sulfurimonas sp.]
MLVDANFCMNLALKEAWKYQGFTYPNPAVGCTIVSQNGELLAVDAHKKAGEAHAEVNALQSAYFKITDDNTILSLKKSIDIHNYLLSHHNNIFHNVILYTTLEPCSHQGKTPSCASLISELGIKEVYVGSYDTNEKAQNGNQILIESGSIIYKEQMLQACDALLSPFKMFLNHRFVFFKWAQRLNGTIDDGIISSSASRKHVHGMRNVCDLLVIGGNTVRADRPTLDARLVNGKAPDILILSREKDFDKTIPLFNVKGREVFIESGFSKLEDYKNIMIEGTSTMYELSKEYVDLYLCYLAPSFAGSKIFDVKNDTFEILNIQKESQDIIMWMKREV